MDQTSPVVLFVYNRLEHTKKTIEALKGNFLAKESELYIYSDAAKDSAAEPAVDELRSYLNSVTGFRHIHICLRKNNLGVDDNIIQGVTEVIRRHGRIIVLEDDLVTSPWFLKFMNEALDFYKDNEDVIAVNGYVYPLPHRMKESFFLKGADCWGWATWEKEWGLFEANGALLLKQITDRGLEEEFNFNGTYPYFKALEEQAKGNTKEWDIRWYASAFLAEKLSLYPAESLVHNIGNDGSGTHCGDTSTYDVAVAQSPVSIFTEVKPNPEAYAAFADFLIGNASKGLKKSWLSRAFKKVKSNVKMFFAGKR